MLQKYYAINSKHLIKGCCLHLDEPMQREKTKCVAIGSVL